MNLVSRVRRQAEQNWVYIIPLLVVAGFSYLSRNLQVDDALIYLRYIRNVIEGHGLTYNPGEKFNGLTSPLNTYLMLIAAWILRNFQLAMIALSAVFFAAAAVLAGKVLARTRAEAIFTASVIGATAYFYSTFGLETTLFLSLIGLSLYLYRLESDWVVISLALLLITRSEGVFLCAVIGIDYLWRYHRLPDLPFIVAAAVIILFPYLFNFLYYGSIIAATASAKISQGRSGLWGNEWIFLDLQNFIPWFLKGSEVAAAVFVLLALLGVITSIRDRLTIIILLFNLLLATFYIGLNIPNYHWYYAPFVYFILLFTCRAIFALISFARGRQSHRSMILAVAAIAFTFSMFQAISFQSPTGHRDYTAIGNWLRANTPEDSSVAMVEIGTVGWYSERRVIDMLGLVNPHNAEYIGNREFLGWLKHYQPDYILRHEPVWEHEQSIPLLEQSTLYRPVDFQFPGYVLLERSPSYSPEMVPEFAKHTELEQKYLRVLQQSSNLTPPVLVLDPTGLFAHPPISLDLTIEEPLEGLRVRFGISETAQALHLGVCFHVRSENITIMSECIEQGAPLEELEQVRVIDKPFDTGDRVFFDIDCSQACDYAWTSWRQVKDKDLPDFVTLLQQM